MRRKQKKLKIGQFQQQLLKPKHSWVLYIIWTPFYQNWWWCKDYIYLLLFTDQCYKIAAMPSSFLPSFFPLLYSHIHNLELFWSLCEWEPYTFFWTCKSMACQQVGSSNWAGVKITLPAGWPYSGAQMKCNWWNMRFLNNWCCNLNRSKCSAKVLSGVVFIRWFTGYKVCMVLPWGVYL